jgi:hypothetical protein
MAEHISSTAEAGIAEVRLADEEYVHHLGEKMLAFTQRHPDAPRMQLKDSLTTEFMTVPVDEGELTVMACRHYMIGNPDPNYKSKNQPVQTWFVRSVDGSVSAVFDTLAEEHELVKDGEFESIIPWRQAKLAKVVTTDRRSPLEKTQATLLSRALFLSEDHFNPSILEKHVT